MLAGECLRVDSQQRIYLLSQEPIISSDSPPE